LPSLGKAVVWGTRLRNEFVIGLLADQRIEACLAYARGAALT